jgi:Ser/Thr protein kinase RdoA (MazF antagonist)
MLRIAPEHHLRCEVFFGRMAKAHRLPTARLIHYDLQRTLVPFDYTLEHYVCGTGVEQIAPDAPHLLHALGRQVGRALRRMHQVNAPGWGVPTETGRWKTPDWPTVLTELHDFYAAPSALLILFSEQQQEQIAALTQCPLLHDVAPRLVHGMPGPDTVRCTVGDHMQLEALVDPGPIIGGDPMLDLAWALAPTHPAPWQRGVSEGYHAVAPLTTLEQQRLDLLLILAAVWRACRSYARAEPHEAAYDAAMQLLELHRPALDALLV